MGTELHLSVTFHPQTDRQSKTILKDMMRAYALDQACSQDRNLSLLEFAYNNSYHASIDMPPFEALYGRRCKMPVCWDEAEEREPSKVELIDQAIEVVKTTW